MLKKSSVFQSVCGIVLVVSWMVKPAGGDDLGHPVESLGARPITGMEAIRAFGPESEFRVAASSVGQLSIELASHAIMQVCTGSVIASDLVLTARHCFEYPDDTTGIIEQLHPITVYFALDALQPYSGTVYNLDPHPVEIGVGDFDFMVLRSEKPFDLAKRRIPPAAVDPRPGEDLYVIHNPFGQTLTLTRYECSATDKPVDGVLFRHSCETQPSSSGAPIFDTHFRLKGIHTRGGKNENPGTFNLGLPITNILANSRTVAASLKAFGHDVETAIASTEPSTARKGAVFRFDDGRAFVQDGDRWSFTNVGGASAGTLKPQASAPDEIVLWDPMRDFLYRIPRNGGMVRGKQGGDLMWSEIGRAQKI
jgi:hypothetical protein